MTNGPEKSNIMLAFYAEMYNITLISPDTTNADGAHNGAIVAICLDGGGSYDNTVLDKEPSVPEG